MIPIKSAAEIADKWSKVTPGRRSYYQSGVAGKGSLWEANAKESEDLYAESLRRAIDEKRRLKGIEKAGAARWQGQVDKFGPGHWSEGVAAGGPQYQKNWSEMREVIATTDLPEKYPAGDPRNWDRSKLVGLRLHAKKIGASLPTSV